MKPPRKPYSGGPKKPPQGRDGARGFGPRPSTPRPASSRPASSRPQGDRPRSDRPGDDRPREDRPREDRPRGDRPREGRPQGNTLVLAPRAEAPRPERPRTERPPRPQPAPEERGEDTPRGSLWLFGIHAVAAALANPARRLRRLLLTEEAEAELAGKLKQPWAMQPERCDRARLEQLLGRGIVHQGAALLADPLAMPSLAQALERPGPVLVLDQVSDPRNVGAIIRSAAAFGVACVITQDRNAPDETGTLAKAASGALETLPMLRAVNIARTLVALRAAGLWVIGLDASGPPISGPALVNRRVALVLGSEGEGLRRLTKETCDEVAGIAMPGGSLRLDSLNVSAAAAVALYEMSRK
jgi:23S rRNA (guanosine2251-2'-O)-methyltransferase